MAGLLADLKRRGMLDETLVIWGGEFGRMPVSQDGKGRHHNPHGFLIDHERLTYAHKGRAFRLTDVAGKVLHAILA